MLGSTKIKVAKNEKNNKFSVKELDVLSKGLETPRWRFKKKQIFHLWIKIVRMFLNCNSKFFQVGS